MENTFKRYNIVKMVGNRVAEVLMYNVSHEALAVVVEGLTCAMGCVPGVEVIAV